MQIGLLSESGVIAVRDAPPGSILFQVAPQDRNLAAGIILGFLEAAQEDRDFDSVTVLESALAEIGGESFLSNTDKLESGMFDIDVRILRMSGDTDLQGTDPETVIFLFDAFESDLAVDVLESALDLGVFRETKAERIRMIIKSIGGYPTSIN